MRIIVLILCISVLYLPAIVETYDGSRKGKTIGGGIGFGPVSSWSDSDGKLIEDNKGIAACFYAGYAFNEKNRITISFYANLSKSPSFDDRAIFNTWYGIEYQRFLFSKTKSPYLSIGYGRNIMRAINYLSLRGWGFLAGIGYEFREHLSIGAHYSWGNSFTCDEKFKVKRIDLMITLTRY